jgi:molybdate transport system substrate-binding protein
MRSQLPAPSPVARLVLVAFALLGGCKARPPQEITVAAAASLRPVLPALIAQYGRRVAATYAASGELRKQVEAGAPVDAVLLASPEPVDQLIGEGLADAASRRVFATNQLVLVGAGKTRVTFDTLDRLPPSELVAIGDPRSVPAGQYARDLLVKLGKWDALQGHLVLGGDVTAVLAYARRGEVTAAVVYATDAASVNDVHVLDRARSAATQLVAAATKSGRGRAFVDFLGTSAASVTLSRFGFGAPP